MVGEVEKMVAVGLVWGATNALMRKGAIKWDEAIKSSPQPNTPQNPLMASLKNWVKLVLIWQYSLPFLLNLSASATFFAILSDTPISLAVPVTNATTFAATAVFGLILGEETRVGLALFGYVARTLRKCGRIRVGSSKSSAFLKDPTRVRLHFRESAQHSL